jgi:hypothetical protein
MTKLQSRKNIEAHQLGGESGVSRFGSDSSDPNVSNEQILIYITWFGRFKKSPYDILYQSGAIP